MRVSSCAAAAAVFAFFVGSAHSREAFTPNGSCLALCDLAPTPTPVPSPTVQAAAVNQATAADKAPDEPVTLHRQRHRFVVASGVGKLRFWRQAHAGRTNAAYVHTRKAPAATPQGIAAAPHPVVSNPPASPVAAPTSPSPQVAPSAPSEFISAGAADSGVSNSPRTAEPRANPVERDPDHSARLLAEAFSQQQQQAAVPAESPKASPSSPESESALSLREAALLSFPSDLPAQ